MNRLVRLPQISYRPILSLQRSYSVYDDIPNPSRAFNEREKSNENAYMRKHEEEVLRKMREELKKKD